MNTELGMEANIYLGPIPGPRKRHMQMIGPEA